MLNKYLLNELNELPGFKGFGGKVFYIYSAMSHSPIPLHLSLHLLAFASACVLSCFTYVWLFATLWTVALQGPLSMGFSRQEYWQHGLLFPPSGDLPNPGIKPTSLRSPALVGGFFTTSATWEAHSVACFCSNPDLATCWWL